MLIKNLPRPIKELVFKRQIEQGNQPNEELTLAEPKFKGNFLWQLTPEGEYFWLEINESNYKPFFEKYGGVILCTSFEQGEKIIDFFKSLGVYTRSRKGKIIGGMYGLINNKFEAYSKNQVKENNIPIFTLDELDVEQTPQTPQKQPQLPEIIFEGIEMEVWDDGVEDNLYHKSKVIAKINGRYLIEDWTFWDNARPIPQKVKVTKEQIAEAFNISVDDLKKIFNDEL